MSIAKKIAGGFGLTLVVLLIVGLLTYRSTTKLIDINGQVGQSYEVILDVKDVFSSLKDAQRAVRGYVISGVQEWLEPYKTAQKDILQKMKEVRKSSADKPQHQKRLDAAQTLITDFLKEMQRFVDLRNDKDEGKAAAEAIKQARGHKDMEAIRSLLEEIEQEEIQALEQRRQEAEKTGHATIVTIGIATLLAFVLVAAASFFLIRSILRPVRKLLEGTEKIRKGDLTFRVNLASHDEIGELARAFDRMAEKRQQAA